MGAVKFDKEWVSSEEYVEYLRHFSAYLFAEKFVSKKDVLEIGCGMGYGSHHLAKHANSVTAIDMSNQRISYCKEHYPKEENIEFMLSDGTNIPFEKNSFDIVISFQVIEHIGRKDVEYYLAGIKKVLKDGGILIITTPNKKLRLLPFQKPWNPEHMIEYDKKTFEKLLSRYFDDLEVCGVCGSEKIFKIESSRVKQSYLMVYLLGPLNNLITKKMIKLGFRDEVKSFSSKKDFIQKTLSEEEFKKFSVNDFKISKNCPRESLDLIAVCRIS